MENTFCPYPNMNTDPLWQKHLSRFKGDEVAAFEAWENNNYSYDNITYSEDIEDSVVNSDYYTDLDIKDIKKSKILEDITSTLKYKLRSIQSASVKHPHLDVVVAEMTKLVSDLKKHETDAALIKFITASERMINSSLKWLDQVKEDPSKNNAKTLKRIHESISSFSILQELSEDFFEDPEYKEEFKKTSELLSKINQIHSAYIDASRNFIVDQITPSFTKIQAFYRERAERLYNEKKLKLDKARGLKGKELEQSKTDYIYKFLTANKEKIDAETKQYVKEMVIQTGDISTLIRYVESPKDMHHDLMDFALKTLDLADRDIRNNTISKTYEANSLLEAFYNQVGKQSDPKKTFEKLFAKDENGTILPILINPGSTNWEQFDNNHKDDAVRKLHTFLTNVVTEKSKMVGKYKDISFKLPQINKSNYERLISTNNPLMLLKEGIMDHFKLRGTDTEFGNVDEELKIDNNKVKVKANAQGNEREEIPLHYRASVKESDLSYDIVSSMLIDYNNSLQYKSRLETGLVLQILRDTIAEANIIQRKVGNKKLKVNEFDKTLTKSAIDSNILKAVDSLIRHRIYGISVEGDPKVAKILTTLKNATSVISLGGNLLSGAANYLQGQTVLGIEAVGKKHNRYSIQDRVKASAKLTKDMVNVFNDVGEMALKSKTNQLLNYFNVMSDYSSTDIKFINNSKLKKTVGSGNIMFANQLAEFNIQATLMYSRFNNIKVLNANGEYLDKNYKPTTNREDALSIDEAITFNDKGLATFNEAVHRTEITSGISEDDMYKIEVDIRRINRDMFGNYDSTNKAEAQRNAWSALIYQMRNWIVPGLQKRYKGIGNVKTKTSDLDIDQRTYNAETDTFEEGTYTTAIKFVVGLFKDFKKINMMTIGDNWNGLTNLEKANIKQCLLELGIAFSALMLSLALKGEDDDDEEALLAIYLSRRLYSEMISFANPEEALRTFRSPAMSTNTIESVIDLITQGFHPSEVYETGTHAGEYKIKRKFSKLIPLWKQWDRNLNESLLFLEK